MASSASRGPRFFRASSAAAASEACRVACSSDASGDGSRMRARRLPFAGGVPPALRTRRDRASSSLGAGDSVVVSAKRVRRTLRRGGESWPAAKRARRGGEA